MSRATAFRILLTGSTGQVGHELLRSLGTLGEVVAPSRSEMDLANPESIRRAMRAIAPALVVNPAAYTHVDRAESEPELCEAVNAAAPGIIAAEAARLGSVMIHYSTDYVFDGASTEPYSEDDDPAPLNVYGATKLAGERAVVASGAAAIVLRTSWVYGRYGHNFMRTMLRLAREREELRVVNDQFGAPTWSASIATATAAVARRLHADPRGACVAGREKAGIYHLTAAGRTSWHGFAQAILALDPRASEHRARRVEPVSSAEFPGVARRPANSLLDSRKAARAFGVEIGEWRDDLALALHS